MNAAEIQKGLAADHQLVIELKPWQNIVPFWIQCIVCHADSGIWSMALRTRLRGISV